MNKERRVAAPGHASFRNDDAGAALVAARPAPSCAGNCTRDASRRLKTSSLKLIASLLVPASLVTLLAVTGFRGAGIAHRAIKGHRYGLGLSNEDRTALIAFLKTL